MLLPEYWGKGYGSEIAGELLHRVDKLKSIKLVTAVTSSNNSASKNILIKHVFVSEKVYMSE
ncbi:GNAT family N-acetyltransferase [Clostridium swellfunianum]|uniref:GNAT family N-acetyltransferase n=1 Tax=Clostridium swellfunianum TaxID=1367462 RepID=UPI003D7C298F|nr:GNAT family N-acetyltransferase [Clostridium swellfunianum]